MADWMRSSRTPRGENHPVRAAVICIGLWALGSGGLFFGVDHRLRSLSAPEAATSLEDGALPEDSRLFNTMRDLGMLTADADGRLVAPSPDWALTALQKAAAEGGPSPAADKGWAEKRAAVRAYYGPFNGRQLRLQTALWNRSLFPVSVRDDAAAASGVAPVWLAAPAEVLAAGGWAVGGLVEPLPLSVPEHHHFFAAAASPGMSAWKVFGGGPSPVVLFTRFSPPYPADGLTVQVLGDVDLASLPPGWRAQADCAAGPCVRHVLRSPAGLTGDTELRLKVRPVRRDERWATAGALRIARRADGTPEWLPSRQNRNGGGGLAHTEIATADGVPLVGGDGAPTGRAAALGVLPVIGLGVADPRGVAGQAARRENGDEAAAVGLTINAQIQAAAFAALGEALSQPFGAVGKGEKTKPPADPFAHLRRGALTVIDPDSGAILAAAAWPPPPAGLDLWSVTAFSHRNPAVDPFAPIGWQAVDSERAPGSTFKLATGLALAAAEADAPQIKAFVKGCAPQADGFFPCLGFGTGSTGYAIPPQGLEKQVRNFLIPGQGYQKAGDSLGASKLERAPACIGGLRVASRSLGEAQALRDSLNGYFVRGAELMDAADARRYDRQMRRVQSGEPYPPPPKLRLADLIDALGFGETVDLAGAARAKIGEPKGMGMTALTMAPAQADIFDLFSRPAPRPNRVKWEHISAVDVISRTAIGQQIYPTPLQMARVAAAARNGAVPVPHLIQTWNGETMPAPASRPLPPGDRGPVVEGMKMVAETGTAAGKKAFGRWDGTPAEQIKCGVFGKTGTSEVAVKGKQPHTTAWFVGWIEPEALAAAGDGGAAGKRPLAFSCMVTHGFGDRRTGGGVCAPIVADFVDRLVRGDAPRQAASR